MIKSARRKWNGSMFIGVFAVVGGFILQHSCTEDVKPFEFNGHAQGTTYRIIYYAHDSIVRRSQLDSIFDRLNNSLSIYQDSSLINLFNSSQSGIKIDGHLLAVVEKSLAIFEDSGGLFDITILPIVRAWGFGRQRITVLPDSGKINHLMDCVGSGKLFLKNGFLGKSIPCVEIDVNGIAQGYTVDVIADFLESNFLNDYLVEVGGELRVKGHKQPEGELMQIGIEGPTHDDDRPLEIRKTLSLSKGAVTTSGTYRNRLRIERRTITHLMDPKTGFPINNEMISATVVARDAITADGYDNVLMNLGVKEALHFMERHPEMEAYLIYQMPDGSIGEVMTPGFNQYTPERR